MEPLATASFVLANHYLRHVAEQVRSSGGDVARWLAACDLKESELDRVALDAATFAKLVELAVETTKEPALGIVVGRHLVATTHGVLGFAVTSSTTVREAVGVVERFTALRTSFVTIRATIGRDVVRLRVDEARPLGSLRRPLLEAVVVSTKLLLDTITAGASRVVEVGFAFPKPSYASLAREVLGTTVRWGSRQTTIAFESAILDVPLHLADASAFEAAKALCERELAKLHARATTAGRVREVLLQSTAGFPSLRVVARSLGVSPRTLHRRLLDEETSFRAVVEATRRALAVELVRSKERTIEEIAYALGYTDVANFRRAFRRWEGVAPSKRRGH